jgi:nitrate reductase NapE component
MAQAAKESVFKRENTAADTKVAVSLKTHFKFWLLLAVSFLFGFGFLVALIYLIYLWFKKRGRT